MAIAMRERWTNFDQSLTEKFGKYEELGRFLSFICFIVHLKNPKDQRFELNSVLALNVSFFPKPTYLNKLS
jgi:hypothetical protein